MQADLETNEPPVIGTHEFREWVIAQFMTMGMSRAVAEAQYDEQANWKE